MKFTSHETPADVKNSGKPRFFRVLTLDDGDVKRQKGEKMILDDIKNFITQNSLANEEEIKFDFDSTSGENTLLVSLYNSLPCDLARRSSINIKVKNSDLKLSRDTCFAIHDLLFPEDGFQKSVLINGKRMHVLLNKGPLYLEKDTSKRHVYVLDITLTHNR